MPSSWTTLGRIQELSTMMKEYVNVVYVIKDEGQSGKTAIKCQKLLASNKSLKRKCTSYVK